MTKKQEGILSNVASSIGATIGAIVAKTSGLAEVARVKEKALAKSIKKRVGNTKAHDSKTKSHKPSNRKAPARKALAVPGVAKRAKHAKRR